jgi:glycerol kinase
MPGRKRFVVVIDAGTTSVRVFCYDQRLRVVSRAQQEFTQHFPRPGWVEHDAAEIWRVTQRLLDRVLRGRAQAVAAIGITNQRETTVVWNRRTGRPIWKAIVWQCRRTADECERLKLSGVEPLVRRKTGLVCDAYFSGTKIQWILKQVRVRSRDLAFGTIDSWLIWNLTGGAVHTTDPTNASRTMLYNIRRHHWDTELADLLDVPLEILPEVRGSGEWFGDYRGIPILAVIGDQQAALYGQGCRQPGQAKNTYGTGCFLLMNVGDRFVPSHHGLLTTLAVGAGERPVYALEGSVFMGGALIQWLRDQLGVIATPAETEQLARSVPDSHGVTIVPAFAGLGAPYWDQQARGLITGLTRGADRRHIARAGLEAIAFQVTDLVAAMEEDSGLRLKRLAVDGGAAANNFLLQFQADLLGRPVVRPLDAEATARGAALLAGRAAGLVQRAPEARPEKRPIGREFRPAITAKQRRAAQSRWQAAVAQARVTPTA